MSMLRNVFSTISTESVKHSSTGNDEKNSFLSDDKSHLSTKKENEEKKDISLPIPAPQDTTPYLSALPHQVLLYNTIPYLTVSELSHLRVNHHYDTMVSDLCMEDQGFASVKKLESVLDSQYARHKTINRVLGVGATLLGGVVSYGSYALNLVYGVQAQEKSDYLAHFDQIDKLQKKFFQTQYTFGNYTFGCGFPLGKKLGNDCNNIQQTTCPTLPCHFYPETVSYLEPIPHTENLYREVNYTQSEEDPACKMVRDQLDAKRCEKVPSTSTSSTLPTAIVVGASALECLLVGFLAYRIRTKQGVAKTIGDLRDNNLVENLYNIYKVFSPSTNAENFRQLTVQTVKSNLLSFFKNSSVSEILPKKHNSEEVVIHVRPA